MQERRGIVPKKLNDKQVSELVIEHANGTSISALAKKYGIARNTVKAYISSNCNYGNFAIKKFNGKLSYTTGAVFTTGVFPIDH